LESAADYEKAINSALLEQRPHIVVISEEGSAENAAWKEAFIKTVHGDDLWKFSGAVVICADSETEALQARCSERWVAEVGGVGQRHCFRVIENALVGGLKELQEDAAQIAYCDLNFWIQQAQDKGFKVIAITLRLRQLPPRKHCSQWGCRLDLGIWLSASIRPSCSWGAHLLQLFIRIPSIRDGNPNTEGLNIVSIRDDRSS
jgi:hypothetical protein